MRFSFLFLFLSVCASAQDVSTLLSKIKITQSVPADLLSAKSAVLYAPTLQQKELELLQKSFQQTGIDVVEYYENDLILAGKDVALAFANAFISREIKFFIFFDKTFEGYSVVITPFNGKNSFIDDGQTGWQVKNTNLTALGNYIYGTALSSQKRQNFLVSDFIVNGIIPPVIRGRRSEFFAIDLQVDKLAVPKFGDPVMDADLEAYFKANFPFQYQLVDANADEKELRKQGILYTLCFVHARNRAAKQLLAYDLSKPENVYTSVTYPNGQLQLKTISSEAPVYKFYFRHIDSGNTYLGTKWDADVQWQDALNNHVRGLKAELKIN